MKVGVSQWAEGEVSPKPARQEEGAMDVPAWVNEHISKTKSCFL